MIPSLILIFISLFLNLRLGLANPENDEAANNTSKRLIKTSESEPPKWMTEEEIWNLIQHHATFMDVTKRKLPDAAGRTMRLKKGEASIPTSLRFKDTMPKLFDKIDKDRMETFYKKFTSFRSRFMNSSDALPAADWLKLEVMDTAMTSKITPNVTAFRHDWPQYSIIARMEGTDPSLKDQIVVLGAHHDSINRNGAGIPAPGADDNGSGSALILEVFRILTGLNLSFKRSVEFHWYAAEEVGLKGSGDISESYFNQGKSVVGMLNVDCPGYRGPESEDVMAVHNDNSDPLLADFLRLVVKEYTGWGVKNATCGYACSDHATWHSFGFPAGFVGVTKFSPYWHSRKDTLATVSLDQMVVFTKVGLAGLVEMAEPSTGQ